MADDQIETPEPIILKKRIKPRVTPHGGAWKVAYADFVTAMMAFFLLLWLLNVTTDEQKAGISNLFEPESVTVADSAGTGGTLAGLALSAVGAMRSAGSPPSITIPIPSRGGFEEQRGVNEAVRASDRPNPDSDNVEDRRREEEDFDRARAELRLAMEQSRELQKFQDSLLVDMTPEGLRIQVIDQERIPMFKPGGADMHPYSRALLELITGVIARFPNRLSISGHTDAGLVQQDGGYSNWELSAERANSARRVMVSTGLLGERVEDVVGRAATELLFPDEPLSPRNRRISIVLLHERTGDRATTQEGATRQ